MQFVIEVKSGSSSGEKIRLNSGQTVSVGRTGNADFAFPHDTYLSSVHFALECEGDACQLRDLNSSNGTSVNGKQVNEATLREGDEIVAGRTTFIVRLEAVADAPSGVIASSGFAEDQATTAPARFGIVETESQSPSANRLLEILREQPEPLFALLDAARDRRVLELLRAAKEEYQSLYEGEQGRELEEYAPYLVHLPPQSDFLERLVQEGWGRSWGLYLTCDRPFAKVRRYLRQFLIVRNEAGQQLYFRFYDPRVMRIYLPTCNAAETARLFGPISRYLVEAAEPDELLQFTDSGQGAAEQKLSLSA